MFKNFNPEYITMENIHAIRLTPGADLKKSIQSYVDERKFNAAWIISAVGSLTNYHFRFANQSQGTNCRGHFEILGLSGTLSVNGSHIHIYISDEVGNTTGGHLLDGCIIYTTAEIIIQHSEELIFRRKKDDVTSYNELNVERKH